MMASSEPLPVVAASPSERGYLRRVADVSLLGVVLTTWMGLVEAVLVMSLRTVPEPLLFVRRAVVGYAVLGLVAGTLWGALVELVTPRHGRWRRRAFYTISVFVLVLLFQLILHTHVHWSGFALSPGSAASLKVTALEAAPAFVIVIAVWVLCVMARSPAAAGPILRPRTAGILAAPLLIAAVLPSITRIFHRPAQSSLPNVLMVVLDTTRVDRLSAYGYERPTTPALEKIAAEGLTFRHAASAAPWTLPSHASIFTGELPAVHNANWEHQHLDDRLPTLAEHLAGQGLTTAAFAHQAWLSDETGLMRGFEDFHDLYWRSTTALGAVIRLVHNQIRARQGLEDKGATAINAAFMAWIDRHPDESFFAFINYMEPHAFYEPPSPFREQFLGGRETPMGRTEHVAPNKFNAGAIEYTDEAIAIFSDLYDGAVAYQDARMGEMLDFLRDRGILDETLLIITADHGENLGDHGLFDHQFCLYDTLVHVPLIVRFPGVVPAGIADDTPVENRLLWSMIDAIFEAPGSGPVPPELIAASMQSMDQAGRPIVSELYRRPLDSELWQDSPRRSELDRRLRALQLNGMKYIWTSDGRDELYDLRTDPQERVNLAAARNQELRALRDLLLAKMASLKGGVSGEAPEFSEELKRRLKSLGYLD